MGQKEGGVGVRGGVNYLKCFLERFAAAETLIFILHTPPDNVWGNKYGGLDTGSCVYVLH